MWAIVTLSWEREEISPLGQWVSFPLVATAVPPDVAARKKSQCHVEHFWLIHQPWLP